MEGVTEPIKEAVVKALLQARDAMLGIRNHMRQMGEAAGIPVGYCLFDLMLASFHLVILFLFPYSHKMSMFKHLHIC